jgi:hypothetical protein
MILLNFDPKIKFLIAKNVKNNIFLIFYLFLEIFKYINIFFAKFLNQIYIFNILKILLFS